MSVASRNRAADGNRAGALARNLAAGGIGVLFAVGLALAGMTQPSKVIAFFDFSRGLASWDPSLALVMAGGMAVYWPVFRLVRRRERPLLDGRFHLPTRNDIDRRLIGGAALFGIGWGLAGFCPGPALTSLGALSGSAVPVVLGMLLGMAAFQVTERALRRGTARPRRAKGARS